MSTSSDNGTSAPLLSLRDVSVTFPGLRGARGRRGAPVAALRSVSFDVGVGQTVSLVGESGCGKTTLTRVVLGLQAADSGVCLIDGQTIPLDGRHYPRQLRRTVQVVFQDPYAALNPAMPVRRLVAEGLVEHGIVSGDRIDERVDELLLAVGLNPSFAHRYPRELSGGQRQRVSIARALAPEPRLLLLDEPISSLDVSTQAQILDLLASLQERLNLSYLFVSHDLGLVKRISHSVVVLYRGQIMEAGPAQAVWDSPQHPYTQLLDVSVPMASVDPAARAQRHMRRQAFDRRGADVALTATGCSFVDRCPRVMEQCGVLAPVERLVDHDVLVACHRAGTG
jgi:oligopeptide/dipeptide ABC transporter ATP-binding protein